MTGQYYQKLRFYRLSPSITVFINNYLELPLITQKLRFLPTITRNYNVTGNCQKLRVFNRIIKNYQRLPEIAFFTGNLPEVSVFTGNNPQLRFLLGST